MSGPFETLATVDRLIHEPARFAILTALAECRRADFVYLQSLIGISNGNLSQHLTKLHAAGLIDIEKTTRGQMPRTLIRLNRAGRQAIEAHWAASSRRVARLCDGANALVARQAEGNRQQDCVCRSYPSQVTWVGHTHSDESASWRADVV